MSGFAIPREIIGIREAPIDIVERLRNELSVSPLIATILANRGLNTYDECRRFFNPDPSQLLDPYLFPDMENAVRRITKAINEGEKITIHGDFDVDGISSTALLVRGLRDLGAQCDYYLPNRISEGYGLSCQGVDDIAALGTQLIITVDCGISSREEVQRAAEKGVDVIVTDHHEPHGELPKACAILNPMACDYPEKHLAGVGVALKLVQALFQSRKRDDSEWYKYIDLAALGTAADIVKLRGENRVIVKFGFESMAQTSNLGLQKLIEAQGLKGKRLNTREVVFLLAPCINAAGRLGDSSLGARLLLTQDAAEATDLARKLLTANDKRRKLDTHVQDSAIAWVEHNCLPERDYALVAAHESWHIGVVGISASRLVERFHRPSFLFAHDKDGTARGSGRSIPGLHLLEALEECSDLLEKYGGHAAAAGATIMLSKLEAFRERFNDVVREKLKGDPMRPRVHADAEAEIGQLTPKFLNTIKRMEPFGPGNMRPVLLCKGLRSRYAPRIVGKKHLKMTVAGDGMAMDAIAFNFGNRMEEVSAASEYSLAFCLDQNEYKGRVSLQMKVKGFKAS